MKCEVSGEAVCMVCVNCVSSPSLLSSWCMCTASDQPAKARSGTTVGGDSFQNKLSFFMFQLRVTLLFSHTDFFLAVLLSPREEGEEGNDASTV